MTDTARPLDVIDRCLVALLQTNGRLTHAKLARGLGVPEPTVRRRMNSLLDDGVMQIVAVPDPYKIGYGIHAIIGQKIQPGKVGAVVEMLRSMRQVRYIGLTTGAYDIVIEALFRNNDELRTFLTETLGGIDGLQGSETSYVLEVAKRSYKVGLAADIQGECETEQDREILERCRVMLRELEGNLTKRNEQISAARS